MTRLVLLGGPTGVGKTTALKNLQSRLSGVALLDADDVWRVSDDLGVPENRGIAIGNTISVMRGYFEAGCETGILSWVFARALLYQPVLDGLADLVDSAEMLYLISSPEALENRLLDRGQPELLDYALSRLRLIEDLPFPKLDTTDLSPEEVAGRICSNIGLPTHPQQRP